MNNQYKCVLEPAPFKIGEMTAWVGSVNPDVSGTHTEYLILIQENGGTSGYDYRFKAMVPNYLVNIHNGFNPAYAVYLLLKHNVRTTLPGKSS